MFEAKFLGVPLVILGIGCLVFAVVWCVIWPRAKASSLSGVRYFILRWFHALTWLLLAIAAFIAAFGVLGGSGSASAVAFASLVSYIAFMLVTVTSR